MRLESQIGVFGFENVKILRGCISQNTIISEDYMFFYTLLSLIM
jgi:hypothetical protein